MPQLELTYQGLGGQCRIHPHHLLIRRTSEACPSSLSRICSSSFHTPLVSSTSSQSSPICLLSASALELWQIRSMKQYLRQWRNPLQGRREGGLQVVEYVCPYPGRISEVMLEVPSIMAQYMWRQRMDQVNHYPQRMCQTLDEEHLSSSFSKYFSTLFSSKDELVFFGPFMLLFSFCLTPSSQHR